MTVQTNVRSADPLMLALAYLRYHKRSIIFSLLGTTGLSYLIFQLKKLYLLKYYPKTVDRKTSTRSRSVRVGVNLRFFAQLKKLLPIIIPGN